MDGYTDYLGWRDSADNAYGLAAPPQQSMTPAGGSDAGGSLMGAGAASGNPYLLGAGFLVSMMNERRKAFEAKKQQAIDLAQNYAQGQNSALNNLGSYWARALGK